MGSERRGKGRTFSSGGIWALWGKKRSTTLSMTAREHPFPEHGNRSCGRDQHEVSQEIWKGSSRSSSFLSHIHMLPYSFRATPKQFGCIPLRSRSNYGKY